MTSAMRLWQGLGKSATRAAIQISKVAELGLAVDEASAASRGRIELIIAETINREQNATWFYKTRTKKFHPRFSDTITRLIRRSISSGSAEQRPNRTRP